LEHQETEEAIPAMRITMLSGGVGGARMARGFVANDDVELTVVVNIADDETIYGLHISPDVDTVLYTLAGVQGPHGWGRADETWAVMDQLAAFPIDTSFRLGDRDLATNLFRTARLGAGIPLSEITNDLARVLGVGVRVLPASDDRIRTEVRIGGGEWLDFQTYFVFRRHADEVTGVRFEGIEEARPAPGVVEAILEADAVLLGPSNPILSVWPIVRIPGIEEALAEAERVALVSPLIGGTAVKGPAVQVLEGLGYEASTRGVLAAYRGLVTDVIVDHADAAEADALDGLRVHVTDTRIAEPPAAERLAKELTAWLA
jgi:LPPG:FO 2-phospho-L-lactate transferase